MSSFFSGPQKNLVAKAKRYEAALQKNPMDDGYGKRYLLPSLYLVLGELDQALRFYEWFDKKYKDDAGDPHFLITRTNALIKAKNEREAKKYAWKTMFSNLYIIEVVLGQNPRPLPLDIWHGSNYKELQHALELSEELLLLWEPSEIYWLHDVYHSKAFSDARTQYIELARGLNFTRGQEKRVQIVSKMYSIENSGDWDF